MSKAGAVRSDQPVSSTGAGLASLGRDDFDRNVWSVLGLPVDMVTAAEAVIAIEAAARDRTRLSFVTPNVNFLVRAAADPEGRRQIIDADLSLVDGAPLVALGRFLGAPIRERCAGSDVFEALRKRPGFSGRRMKVFFFGGRDGAAEAAAAAIDKEKRGLEAAGFFNPGAGDVASMSTPDILDAVNASGADFVLVALGAAKGQAWIDANRNKLDAPVVAHLGAVIDFTAGSIRRAPAWLRKAGLEWAWRIKEEPTLWRRYWNDASSLGAILTRSASALRGVKAAGVSAGATIENRAGQAVVYLSGDLTESGLTPVRAAFRAASRSGNDVVLDFRDAKGIDAAFLGLLLMLEKNLRASGRTIAVASMGRAQRRLLKGHLMNYPTINAGEPASGGARVDGIAAAV